MSTNQVETQAQELASALSCDGDFLYESAYTPNIRWIRAAVPKKVSQICQRFFLCCGRLLFDIPFQISQTVVDTRTANYVEASFAWPNDQEAAVVAEFQFGLMRNSVQRHQLVIRSVAFENFTFHSDQFRIVAIRRNSDVQVAEGGGPVIFIDPAIRSVCGFLLVNHLPHFSVHGTDMLFNVVQIAEHFNHKIVVDLAIPLIRTSSASVVF